MSKNLFYLFAAVTVSAVVYTTYLFASSNNTTPATRQLSTPNLLPVDTTVKSDTYQVNKKTIYNLELNESNTVPVVGVIGSDAMEIASQITAMSQKGKPIYVVLNTPGGSVIDGAQIVSAIQAAKVPVYTVCLSLCASMGAIIFSYGNKRFMIDRALIMFHEAAGGFEGYFNQMKSRMNTFDRYVGKMSYEIATRAHKDPVAFRASLGSEVWLDAEDALSQGFSDGIVSIHFNSSSSDSDINAQLNTSQVNNLRNTQRVIINW